MRGKKDIRELDLEQIQQYIEEKGEKKFRANQVYDWLWKKNARSFEQMTNISKALKNQLEEDFSFSTLEVDARYVSSDGTRKYAFQLPGGHQIEGVLIPTSKRVTACVSSQAGCSLDCAFCATGLLDLKHNLHAYEIYDQIALLNAEAIEAYGRPISNIVYMGMGEPLLNYRNVLKSISLITNPEGMGMAPKRITVSSAGIAKMIRKLGDDNVRFEFALSLHAANDEKRNQIMSINQSNSLESLKEALQYFYEKTQTRITYEYCIFKDFNDSIEDAEELAQFARIIPSKINLIEYNPVAESPFQNTSNQRMNAFIAHLESRKLIVNVRRSRGRDIDGACGQLALRQQRN